MLNLTEKQLDEFEQWKKDTMKQIDFMLNIIVMAVPRDYRDNNFYIVLNRVANTIMDLKVQKDTICYNSEEITSEIKAGSCLRKVICEINRSIEGSGLLDETVRRLEEIFGI